MATVAIAETVAVMNTLEGEAVPRTAYVLREVLPQITETAGAAAGLLSVNYYEEVRADSDAKSAYTPVVRSAQVAEVTQASIGFSIAQITKGVAFSTVIDTLAGNVQRAVTGVDRETLYYNVVTDPDGTRYQRVPQGDSCAFCRTMAAVVEASEEIAHFHSFCRCSSLPVFKGQEPVELPGFEQTRKAYSLANQELTARRRATPDFYALRPRQRAKKYPDLMLTTENHLRLMRQITGWR